MFLEFDKKEQDLMILMYLQAHRRLPFLQDECGKAAKRGFSRVMSNSDAEYRRDITYYFAGHVVCRDFFLFIHDIGKRRYVNLLHHYDTKAIVQRVHGNTGKTPNRENVLKVHQIEKAVAFIRAYADKFGIPLPGRMTKLKGSRIIKLPSSDSKSRVYRQYEQATKLKKGERIIGWSAFRKIWKKYVPYIETTDSV